MKKTKRNTINLLAREYMVTALMQLLKEKPMSAITISEITKKAGVSRMTYYRNYSAKEDIFTSYLEDLADLYREDTKKHPVKENYYDEENLVHCFSHFVKYKDFLQSLFDSGLGNYFLMTISKYVLETWQKPDDGIEHYYELQAFSGALLNIYLSWSTNGEKETPEEMAHIINKIYSR